MEPAVLSRSSPSADGAVGRRRAPARSRGGPTSRFGRSPHARGHGDRDRHVLGHCRGRDRGRASPRACCWPHVSSSSPAMGVTQILARRVAPHACWRPGSSSVSRWSWSRARRRRPAQVVRARAWPWRWSSWSPACSPSWGAGRLADVAFWALPSPRQVHHARAPRPRDPFLDDVYLHIDGACTTCCTGTAVRRQHPEPVRPQPRRRAYSRPRWCAATRSQSASPTCRRRSSATYRATRRRPPLQPPRGRARAGLVWWQLAVDRAGMLALLAVAVAVTARLVGAGFVEPRHAGDRRRRRWRCARGWQARGALGVAFLLASKQYVAPFFPSCFRSGGGSARRRRGAAWRWPACCAGVLRLGTEWVLERRGRRTSRCSPTAPTRSCWSWSSATTRSSALVGTQRRPLVGRLRGVGRLVASACALVATATAAAFALGLLATLLLSKIAFANYFALVVRPAW